MSGQTAFLIRRTLPLVLSLLCLIPPTLAQHGGGGGGHGGGGSGHSGGGHSGGHSSGGHSGSGHSASRSSGASQTSHATGGHFGWLHFGSHGRSVNRAAYTEPHDLPHLPSGLWNVNSSHRSVASSRIPPTLHWFPPSRLPHASAHATFTFPSMPKHHAFFQPQGHCFPSSGCFFNGVTQVCFFEPFLALFSFGADFDSFNSGLGFGDDLTAQAQLQAELAPPEMNPATENLESSSSTTPLLIPPDSPMGKGTFLLVLKNGTTHAVSDYWLADGYLEYVRSDGVRSHIPLESLDLQKTVAMNSPRGLPFVLRGAPDHNRVDNP